MPGLDVMQRKARHAAESPWSDRLARLGFVGRGLVYIVVGLIGLQIAWSGEQGQEASKDGALKEISERPLSGVLLTALAVGAAGYAFWRATEALWGKRDESDERKRTIKRIGSAAKATVYAAFMVSTVRFLLNGPSQGSSGGDEEEGWTAQLLDLPGGDLIAGVVALGIIIAGFYIAYRGFAQKFEKRLDTSDMGPITGRVIDVIGTIGLVARGAVVAVAGYLLMQAAIDHDAEQAGGIDDTLKTVAQQSYGKALLTVTAVGIIVYGLYSFAEARYRQL